MEGLIDPANRACINSSSARTRAVTEWRWLYAPSNCSGAGHRTQRYLLQSARSKVFLAGIGRHNREADALPCACHGQFSTVDAVAAADRHLDDFARSVLKLPGLALQRTEGGDAGQRLQFAHMAWHAGPGQQGGGGNHDAGQCGEFAGDESTVLLMAPVEDDGKVDVLSKYLQPGHPGIAFELDAWMEATEFGEDGSQQQQCLPACTSSEDRAVRAVPHQALPAWRAGRRARALLVRRAVGRLPSCAGDGCFAQACAGCAPVATWRLTLDEGSQ